MPETNIATVHKSEPIAHLEPCQLCGSDYRVFSFDITWEDDGDFRLFLCLTCIDKNKIHRDDWSASVCDPTPYPKVALLARRLTDR